jgi:toxin-antitoxin system PIN domain toxin
LTYLLDVNVLIALIDPLHVAHDTAHHWFEDGPRDDWATCPITENGVLRIVGHPKYPNSPGSPAALAPILAGLRGAGGHAFWQNDISLIASDAIDVGKVLTSAQVTDTYLLALAAARGGKLATLDRRLSPAAVRGGNAALEMIG